MSDAVQQGILGAAQVGGNHPERLFQHREPALILIDESALNF
jgi:hypothetical protein